MIEYQWAIAQIEVETVRMETDIAWLLELGSQCIKNARNVPNEASE